MSTTIDDPHAFDLTPENLAAFGMDTILPGERVDLRFQTRRSGAALSLTGAVLVLSVRRSEASTAAGGLLFQRRSLDLLNALVPSVYRITPDADQAAEDTAADTGKGWYAILFDLVDEALLAASLGLWWYDVRAQFSSGQVRTLLRGRFQILPAQTLASQFTP